MGKPTPARACRRMEELLRWLLLLLLERLCRCHLKYHGASSCPSSSQQVGAQLLDFASCLVANLLLLCQHLGMSHASEQWTEVVHVPIVDVSAT